MTLPIVPEFQVRNLISFRITDPYINFDKWLMRHVSSEHAKNRAKSKMGAEGAHQGARSAPLLGGEHC